MPRTGRNRRFALLTDETSVLDISPDGTLTRPDASRGNLTSPGRFASGMSGKSSNKLQSLFNPFAKTQDKMDQLNELLTTYSIHGPPSLPDSVTRGRPHYDPHTLILERHWTDIVKGHEKMNKRQRDQQEALWELLSTEVEYIRKLRVIIDLFYCCLTNLQNNQLLNEIESQKVFSNICDVFYATCHFWDVHMSQVLKRSRETREPLDPCLLKSGFQVFDKLFEPYIQYCLDQEFCRDYLKSKVKENDLFRTFILWAESQGQCNRLSLMDLIVKPFQRLTKYALLLFALKKPLEKMEPSSDIDQQKRDISKMMEQVERFVLQVNRTLRQRHEHMQLSLMMDRIDSYEAVEVPSDECLKVAEQFCKLDLSMPVPGCGQHEMRNLLFEGGLKLKDTYTKMDVYCFLFTDMLLITKPTGKRGDKVKIIKPPMRLDKIIVHSMRDVASFMVMYLNEYSMAQAVYTFHGDSKLWLAHVTKAQRDYQAKKLSSPTPRKDFHEIERSGSCGSELIARKETARKRTTFSGSAETFTGDHSSGGKQPLASQAYRSQLSVPTLVACDPSTKAEKDERKVSSEKIKRKSIATEDIVEKSFDVSHLSSSTYNLSTAEDDEEYASNTGSLMRRSSIGRHRRHSSDPIRDIDQLNALVLSSSYPGSPDDDTSPSNKKIGWSLGEATSIESQSGLGNESPDSRKTSDDSLAIADSDSSKSNLSLSQLKTEPAQVLDPQSTDTPKAESSAINLQEKQKTLPSDVLEIVIPSFEIQQPSTGNPSPESFTDIELSSDLPERNRVLTAAIENLKQFSPKKEFVCEAPDYVEQTTHKHQQLEISSDPDPTNQTDKKPPKVVHGTEIVIESQPIIRVNSVVVTGDETTYKATSDSQGHSASGSVQDNEIRKKAYKSEPGSRITPNCSESSKSCDNKSECPKDSESEVSDPSRSPEEEFHLCYLPEEYFCFPSPPRSPLFRSTNPESQSWKGDKGRRRAVFVVEASTQTPLEFLIAGYFAARSLNKSLYSRAYRSAWSSKSLPNIFEVLPPADFSTYFASISSETSCFSDATVKPFLISKSALEV